MYCHNTVLKSWVMIVLLRNYIWISTQRIHNLIVCVMYTLTHFRPMFYFYTPENVRKAKVFREYRNGTLTWNGLNYKFNGPTLQNEWWRTRWTYFYLRASPEVLAIINPLRLLGVKQNRVINTGMQSDATKYRPLFYQTRQNNF